MSRPPSRASAAGSRPGSRGSGTTPAPRPPTPPPSTLVGVDVPMGGIAWMDDKGNFEMVTSAGVGGKKATAGTAPAGRHNLFTRGMTLCFTVVILTGKGALLSHVSNYLANVIAGTDKSKEGIEQLNTMKSGYQQLWGSRKGKVGDFRVVIIDGENTPVANRDALLRAIFPDLAPVSVPKTQLKCEVTPNPREARHGTAQVWTEPKAVYMEDRRVM